MLRLAVAGVFANMIAPFDPEENDFASMMVAPGLQHSSAPTSSATTSSPAWSSARAPRSSSASAPRRRGLIGLSWADQRLFRGWFDLVLQRLFDILMAFPLIILALALVSVFGTGMFNMVIAITIRWSRAAAVSCARVR